jgi:serine/threonine protein kinase
MSEPPNSPAGRAVGPPEVQAAEAPTLSPLPGAETDTSDTVKKVHVRPGQTGGSAVGRSFDDFELLEEIGRGGMGVVYKARQKSLDRLVALKMLPTEQSHNANLRARFLAEARAAAALRHPNIVGVYQVGESQVGQYIVMEYLEGQTLETIIQERTIPIPWAVNLLIAVTEAVGYAHSKGVIHRDLKPANVMLDSARRPVVMDFGIAKVLGKSASLTQQGMIMGTPAYMPPEQAGEDHAQVCPASDVYALGAILYTMLTGRVPFDEGTALRTIIKVCSPAMPPAVRVFRPEAPESLEALCTKCLGKRPAERYPTARALLKELRRIRATDLSGAEPASARKALLPSLIVVAKDTGKPVRLSGRLNVIGRTSDSDIQIKAPDVSKRHCQILLEPDQVIVEDLGSANGTSVNGQPITRAAIQDGDELDVAGHLFEIRLHWPHRRKKAAPP